MSTVTVNKRGADRIRKGHLWVYRSDVVDSSTSVGGAVVSVNDKQGNFIGQALFSDRSEISLRFLSQNDEVIDREWWRRRIQEAAARRAQISPDTNAFRLIYSEGDLLPSLIVDKYQDVLVLQTLSRGTEAIKSMIVELLIDEFQPRAVIERNDVRVRELEGLKMSSAVLYGECGENLEITQHGIRFLVSPQAGQKTGSFLDQRENRLAAQRVAHGRALDCFTFNGAFALHLAPVCSEVLGVDISAAALETARLNAELNKADNLTFIEANVFDFLREIESRGERFDTIVLDPPAFAKNRGSVKAAIRGYKEINLRALKLLNPRGVLVTCTCSYHISEQLFVEILTAAAIDARCKLQIVEKRMQSGDHPVLLSVPETHYLKCVIARLVG